MMKKAQSGFTLIELMIVVAIIAILAAIAIPAYNQYIREANITRVDTAYSEGINAVKAEMARRQAMLARGQVYTLPGGADPTDADRWIALVLNPDSKNAPGAATDIFAAAADDDEGVIAVIVGADAAVSAFTVALTRPAYEGDNGGFAAQETATVDTDSMVSGRGGSS